MWQKLRAFHRNAGLFTSASFVTVAVLVTVAGILQIIDGRYLVPILLFWPAVALSWVLRWQLLMLVVKFGGVLRYVAAIVGIAYITRPQSGWFPGDEWIMIVVIALYFGLIFWWHAGSFSVFLSLAVMPKEHPSDDVDGGDESGGEPGTEQPARFGYDANRHKGR